MQKLEVLAPHHITSPSITVPCLLQIVGQWNNIYTTELSRLFVPSLIQLNPNYFTLFCIFVNKIFKYVCLLSLFPYSVCMFQITLTILKTGEKNVRRRLSFKKMVCKLKQHQMEMETKNGKLRCYMLLMPFSIGRLYIHIYQKK